MAIIKPFRAVRPAKNYVDMVAELPYDVMNREEAKKMGEADQTKVGLGEQVYKGGNNATGVAACAACHGPTGAGNPAANFPSLNGQHATYVKAQLLNFRSGARANDAGRMMRNVAAKMSDAEIDSVAEYIAGLK